jgi:alcohol dehydrogenase/L-iditol 2-dehydrogenase
VGLATDKVSFNPLRFVRTELDVRGSIIYDHPTDFAATIDLVRTGRLHPGEHAAAPRALEDLVEIFEAMEAGTIGAKPIVVPSLLSGAGTSYDIRTGAATNEHESET